MQTIPFNEFMLGYVGPSPHLLGMLDGGLTFFVGTGVVLLGLIALEKIGLSINEKTLRFFVLTGAFFAILWAVMKNPLFRNLAFGF